MEQPLNNVTQCPSCKEITYHIDDPEQIARSEIVQVYHPHHLVTIRRVEDGELFNLPIGRIVPKGFEIA